MRASRRSRGLTKCASCRKKSRTYARRAYLKRTAHLSKRKPISSEERNRRVRLRREKRREAGVCVGCGAKRDNTSTRCERCRKRHNESATKSRKKLLEIGICVMCRHRPVMPGRVHCERCRRKNCRNTARVQRRRRKARRAARRHSFSLPDGSGSEA